jgi:Uncharacterized conserved protein
MATEFGNTQTENEVCLTIDSEEGNELIVFNDNIHTFDYVIKALIEVCALSYEQASNCTNIIHYKGLCAVKHGSYDVLSKMCKALDQKELKVEIR